MEEENFVEYEKEEESFLTLLSKQEETEQDDEDEVMEPEWELSKEEDLEELASEPVQFRWC